MKLLLTSTGLESKKIRDFFVSKIESLGIRKTCLIFTIRQESDWQWVEHYHKELEEIGLPCDDVNISEEKDFSNLPAYDIYYVCGGNTFYILDRLRKTNLDKVILEAVSKGKLYVGVSAGSIIMGPDIKVAGIGEEGDENDIYLEDLAGFGLVPYMISPHYTEKEKIYLDAFKEERKGEQVVELTDDQAIFVEDEKMVKI
jgi:dipeptidase E